MLGNFAWGGQKKNQVATGNWSLKKSQASDPFDS